MRKWFAQTLANIGVISILQQYYSNDEYYDYNNDYNICKRHRPILLLDQ